MRSACIEIATRCGFSADGVSEIADLQQLLRNQNVDLLLVELEANRECLQFLEEIRALTPDLPIIMMTAAATIPSAVEAMRSGAVDVLVKPFSVKDLETALDQAILPKRIGQAAPMVGRSQKMDKLYRILANLAQRRHPALIVGESGTGKEMIARMVHAQSEFALGPFFSVDCNTSPHQIERELFGSPQNALPGALQGALGVLASAARGTVFLDEVGQLSIELQCKLLKALQEREITPWGATRSIPLHARVLAASSVDLAAAVTKGLFRKDLYYRLNVVTLQIPPLRERLNDIPLLAAQFLDRRSRQTGQKYTLSAEALRSMMRYDWPNNVRELENTIEHACTMATGPVIHIGDLPTHQQKHELQLRREELSILRRPQASVRLTSRLEVTPLAELEKQAILNTITRLNGDKLLAAHMLGIGKTTLYRKLKVYGMAEGLPVRA
jgi:DNA-binding NtrC family response regulator